MNFAVWLYFLGDKKKAGEKDKLFLYGLVLPTSHALKMQSKAKEFKLNKTDSIYLYQSVIENLPNEDDLIKLNKLNKHCNTEIIFISKQKFIQNAEHYNFETPTSPISSTVHMNVYYTDNFHTYENEKYLDEENKDELKQILNILAKNSSQNFMEGYSRRLGCLEVGEIQEWAENSCPFNLKRTNKALIEYTFSRFKADEKISVHLIVYSSSKEILLDENKTMKKNQKNLVFNTAIKNDALYEYWVFNSNGKLIHKDKAYWMLGINMNLSVLSKVIKNVPYQGNKTKDVTISTSESSIKIDYPDNKTEKIIENRSSEIFNLTNLKKNDVAIKQIGKWFKKSEQNVLHVIKYIEKTASNIQKIMIIDPFIDKEAIKPLSHFNSSLETINIISCWRSETFNSQKEKKKEDIQNETLKYLNDTQDFQLASSKIIWHDLASKKFHDRFIIIEKDTNKEIFMLSNSLNNILKDYDFCLVRLEDTIKQNALKYANSVISECSDNNRVYPEVKDAD